MVQITIGSQLIVKIFFGGVLQCVAVCCSVLQCVAVCCSVLQCVAELLHITIGNELTIENF